MFYALLVVFIAIAIVTVRIGRSSKEYRFPGSVVDRNRDQHRVSLPAVFVRLRSSAGSAVQGSTATMPNSTYIYAKSWLGRYIPGTATWILARFTLPGSTACRAPSSPSAAYSKAHCRSSRH